MMIVGFWGFGWTTAGTAEKTAQARSSAAVTEALVPFCIAKADADPDASKLVKFRAEQSTYTGNQLVRDNGWATLSGASSPDSALASACSDKLRGVKTT